MQHLFNAESEGISKNAKSYIGTSHRYAIVDIETGELYKCGVSSVCLNKNGTSGRANIQVNQLNDDAGYIKYKAVVVDIAEARSIVLRGEQMVVDTYVSRPGHNGLMPPGMKLPRPSVMGAFGVIGVLQMVFHEYVNSMACEPPNCI